MQKRQGAPAIIDGVHEYIPEIKNEIEELTLHKESMLSVMDQNKQLTISVREIAKGELVLQICMKRDQGKLSNLLWNLEAEGISILNASTVEVPHDRVCFHLHIQVYAIWIMSLSICFSL
ncbi:transcription factor bHLH160-like [Syzygium oleosum]|uniref:transcription factor bHLH160-like n=1 Tax=Syzygium oleosum TaxID=219896 RepID=UPI0024BB7E60|nr:transcription factor bHLH160-like [Syzygium oleosum]